MEIVNCPICTSPSVETKCLLFSVKRKLKQLLNDYVPDFNEEEPKEQKNQFSFVQMLKIIFGEKYFSNSFNVKCNHQKICRYMKRKFKCDSKTFQQLCDHLALKIGEKNYHIQVLTNQIKTLSETSLKEIANEEVKSKEQLRTNETLELEERQKNQPQKMAEPLNNLNQNNRFGVQQANQRLNLQLQYFYPFGFYYSPFPSNFDQEQPK